MITIKFGVKVPGWDGIRHDLHQLAFPFVQNSKVAPTPPTLFITLVKELREGIAKAAVGGGGGLRCL